MAYISFQPSDHFNTKLYTGNGAEQAITGVGFQPDWTWIKKRNGAAVHYLFDAVRGATYFVNSDQSYANQDNAQSLKSFDSDGFTLGTMAGANNNSDTFVSWNWKAGTTSGLSGGTITPSAYSINTTSKFGIYKYTGNGSGSQTIAHGLGATPTCVIFKQTSGTEQWRVHFMKAPNPYSKMLFLNSNAAETSQSNGLSSVSSTTITFGNDGAYNSNGGEYICYVFCDVSGFSKFGKYIGNGSTDGPFVYTGFKPAMIIFKITSSTGDWRIFDNKRDTFNVADAILYPSANNAEGTEISADFLSNGFKIRSSSSSYNTSSGEYVYMAFAEEPLVSSNEISATAR